MAGVEHGVVRQVWFAPVSNPADKNSFLIRDDAYSKREAVFGRTIRLGDPVDLGPFGAWRQTNWSGGHDQETWKDEAMFELGTADVSERKGSAKLWNGFTQVYGVTNRPTNYVAHLAPGAVGLGDNVPLNMAERTLSGSPADWRVRRYRPGVGWADKKTFTSPINAIGLFGAETGSVVGYTLVATADAQFWVWNETADTWTQDTGVVGSGAVGWRTVCPFNNATYYIRGNRLQKRVNGTHTVVRQMPEISGGASMKVWNNRLWFLGIMSQGRTGVYVSDGYTVQLAFELPRNMQGFDLCPHYGSLYIRGIINRYGASADERQVVYRYNGSSLSLLHEDDDSDIEFAERGGMCSWGRFLCWSKHGSPALGLQAGVWMYDAEEDAIFLGPTFKMSDTHTKVTVDDVCVWNNTLAVSMTDHTVYTASTNEYPQLVAYVEKSKRPRAVLLDGTTSIDDDKVADTTSGYSNRSFGFPVTTKEQVILSSNYDGGLHGEKKSWVKGFVRCRVPLGCEVEVALLHDDDPTEHSIQTISYDVGEGEGWRDVQFSAVCDTHGTHEKSSKVRYKLYLRNTDLTNYPNNTPEVDVVGLDFMPSPSRRSQYHVRVLCTAAQNDLAGDPNALTTREALVAKLSEYWEAGEPVLFWEPTADGTTPTGTTGSKTVMLNDFLEQTFRIASDGTETMSEVSFNLLEVA